MFSFHYSQLASYNLLTQLGLRNMTLSLYHHVYHRQQTKLSQLAANPNFQVLIFSQLARLLDCAVVPVIRQQGKPIYSTFRLHLTSVVVVVGFMKQLNDTKIDDLFQHYTFCDCKVQATYTTQLYKDGATTISLNSKANISDISKYDAKY